MTKQRNNRRTCCTWRISRHQIILQSFTAKKRCSISKSTQVDHFYTSVYVLEASRDFDYRTTCILCFFFLFSFIFFLPIYLNCLRECCNNVLLWSDQNVLWTAKLHLTFHQHGDERILIEFQVLSELILLNWASQSHSWLRPSTVKSNSTN